MDTQGTGISLFVGCYFMSSSQLKKRFFYKVLDVVVGKRISKLNELFLSLLSFGYFTILYQLLKLYIVEYKFLNSTFGTMCILFSLILFQDVIPELQ